MDNSERLQIRYQKDLSKMKKYKDKTDKSKLQSEESGIESNNNNFNSLE